MSDQFTDFLTELSSGKKGKNVNFKVYPGTSLELDSHISYGIPTRIPALDLSLGRPGWPAGRVVELFGLPHAGKSSGALAAIASVQRMNGLCLLIDTERTYDPTWARLQGVDPSQLAVAHADTIDEIFTIQEKAIDAKLKTDKANLPFITVADSVTGVPSNESAEKEYGEVQRLGTDARSIRSGIRKLNAKIASSKSLAIYVNHSISNTNAMSFAKQSMSAGGHAIKYYSSCRIEFVRAGTLTSERNGEKYRDGIKVKLNIEKNKVCVTGKPTVECELLNTGFDIATNLFDALITIGEIKQINQKNYSFTIPNKEETVQLTKGDWPKFIADYATDVNKVYEWFLIKAQQKGFLKPYER